MVRVNFDFLLKTIYWVASISGFVYVPMDCRYFKKNTPKIFGTFVISCSLSIIGYLNYDAYLETFEFIPSFILEYGLNFVLRCSIFVTIFVKINNMIAKDAFIIIFKNLMTCNELVRTTKKLNLNKDSKVIIIIKKNYCRYSS